MMNDNNTVSSNNRFTSPQFSLSWRYNSRRRHRWYRFYSSSNSRRRRKKMRTFSSSDMSNLLLFSCHFCAPGLHESWGAVRGGKIWWRNQEMLQRVDCPISNRLTLPLGLSEGPCLCWRRRMGHEGCCPWIGTQLLSLHATNHPL